MKTLYAAPGEAIGDGSLKHPYSSLESTRDAVRRLIAEDNREQVVVELAGGTYYLDQPLSFGPEDSGSHDRKVTWRAAADASPVISAGARLECHWEKHETKILKCNIGSQLEGLSFSQLYINGRRQVLQGKRRCY